MFGGPFFYLNVWIILHDCRKIVECKWYTVYEKHIHNLTVVITVSGCDCVLVTHFTRLQFLLGNLVSRPFSQRIH